MLKIILAINQFRNSEGFEGGGGVIRMYESDK